MRLRRTLARLPMRNGGSGGGLPAPIGSRVSRAFPVSQEHGGLVADGCRAPGRRGAPDGVHLDAGALRPAPWPRDLPRRRCAPAALLRSRIDLSRSLKRRHSRATSGSRTTSPRRWRWGSSARPTPQRRSRRTRRRGPGPSMRPRQRTPGEIAGSGPCRATLVFEALPRSRRRRDPPTPVTACF